MTNKHILLVEHNPDHAFLTQRALKKSNVANPVGLARDGQETFDQPALPRSTIHRKWPKGTGRIR
jgi:hypothetical protein